MIWVVNYNAVGCHIYAYEKNIPQLSLLQELKDPINRTKNDPKEVEVDNFSREIAAVLEKGRTNHDYDELIIIGPPHLNGMFNKHISKSVKEMIKTEYQKDFQNSHPKELLEFIQKETKKAEEKSERNDELNSSE